MLPGPAVQVFQGPLCNNYVFQGPLCNNYGLDMNATTPVPSEMTTTNMTMHCWYGVGSVSDSWQEEVCAPEVRTLFVFFL
jgi:hypothetical protein